MKQKKKYLFLMAGWVLLCIFFCSAKAQAAVFHIKKGYSDQALSEYETCLDVTAEDIASGKIYFNSDRQPVFLGDRWQLCWMHCCSIQNLLEGCGIEDIESIETVNIGNKMTFTGEEIYDGSGRFHYIKGSSAMYYDADGSLKVQDFAYEATIWTSESLALFYEADEVPIGGGMDAYNDSSIIGKKWADFYGRASNTSYVDSCLDQGLTFFYGQLDPFDVNRPIEGIHVMYVTLKGNKPGTGEGSGDNDSGTGSDDKGGKTGSDGSSGRNSRNNSKNKSAQKNKTTAKKKTTIKKTTSSAKTNQKKKTTDTKNTTNKKKTSSKKSTDKSTKGGSSNPSQYTPAATPPVTNPATGPTVPGQSAETDQKEEGDEADDEDDETEEAGEKEEDKESGAVAETGGDDTDSSGGTEDLRTITLKNAPDNKDGLTARSEMDPDPKVIPLLILCMLAGAGFCILRFRSQLGQTPLILPRPGRKGGRS